MTFGARISLHQIEPLDRHVKLRFVRVIKQHELAAGRCRGRGDRRRGRSQIERDQSAESRDAVIDMHDEVADFQITKVGEKSCAPARVAFSLA